MVARSTSVFDAARVMLQRMPAGAAGKLIENYLLPDQLDRCWMKAVEDSPGPSVFASFLAAMGVRWDCADDDLARLPANGPVVVVANHPFGLVEGQIRARSPPACAPISRSWSTPFWATSPRCAITPFPWMYPAARPVKTGDPCGLPSSGSAAAAC